MAATWFVECQRNFIKTKERTKAGTPVKRPILVRKMHLSGNLFAASDGRMYSTGYIRVVLVTRKAGDFYSVKLRKGPTRAWWDKAPILDTEYRMVKVGSYSRDEFIEWLKVYVKNPHLACLDLECCQPEILAAA